LNKTCKYIPPYIPLLHNQTESIMNDWNNDLSNEQEETELCDHDFEREYDNDKPDFVYSPFSPYYVEAINN